MTKDEQQNIFNTIVRHARKQPTKSLAYMDNGNGSLVQTCVYRTSDGLACFAGCLIKDEFYDETLEGKVCDRNEIKEALFRSGIPTDDEAIEFIRNIQITHDAYEPSDWEGRFVSSARRYALTVPAPTLEHPLISRQN